MTSTSEKNLGGRPLKFKTVEELNQKIEQYFGSCDPHLSTVKVICQKVDGSTYIADQDIITTQKPYTIFGLARALDTTRATLIHYESGMHDDKAQDSGADNGMDVAFSDLIRRAKLRIAEYVESQLYVRGASNGAQFSLRANFGVDPATIVINKNIQVVEDLDRLDDPDGSIERQNLADEAARALAEAQDEHTGPEAS